MPSGVALITGKQHAYSHPAVCDSELMNPYMTIHCKANTGTITVDSLHKRQIL